MRRLQSQEGLIVDTSQIVMLLLGVDISAEIECSQILFVGMENLAVLRQGVVALLEIDIGLGFEQVQVQVARVLGNPGVEHFEGVAPLLTGLRMDGS